MNKTTLLLVLAAFLLMSSQTVLSVPPIATEFYGRVINFSAINVTVEVRDQNGNPCGSYLLQNESYYGLLSCKGDDPETAVDEGGATSEQMLFYLNGTLSRMDGNTTWGEGDFHEVNITRAEPPRFFNCSGANISEDTSGSQISIDLHGCTSDADNALSQLNFTVHNQSNAALINCSVSTNRYLTCANPAADLNGLNIILVQVMDPVGLFDRTNITINVTPVPDAPRFLQNFSSITLNETQQLAFLANCTDPDGDQVSFETNDSLWPINTTTGLINVTTAQGHVGNHSVNITCSDANFTTGQLLNITVNDINNAPVLDTILPQVAATGSIFRLKINATDADGDVLTFSTNSTLFFINGATGLIEYAPTAAEIGIYNIFVMVTDGVLNDSQVMSLRVVQGPFCGDTTCGNEETCLSCPGDCGICPPAGGGGGGGSSGSGGGGGGGGASPSSSASFVGTLCVERWECSLWSPCALDSKQVRTCLDINRCVTQFSKPPLEQDCIPPSCNDFVLNQDEEGVDCGGVCDPCPDGTCFDGRLNQNENDIDCGGPCVPCFIKDLALVPVLEKPFEFAAVFRAYPWILLLLALIILGAAITYDRYRTSKVRALEFEDYVKVMGTYRHRRRIMFLFAFNLAGILLSNSLYLYYYSFDDALLIRRLWILMIMFAMTPIVASMLLRRYDLRERAIQLKSERARQLSVLEDYELMFEEQKNLCDLELLIARQLLLSLKEGSIQKIPQFYEFLRKEYHVFTSLEKKRRAIITPPDNAEKAELMKRYMARKGFLHACSRYPEFDLIRVRTTALLAAYGKGQNSLLDARDLLLLEKNIEKDLHFQSVIAADVDLGAAFDEIRRTALALEQEQALVESTRKEITTLELEFIKVFQQNDAIIREKIESSQEAIRDYNKLVQLYNRYDKNIELATSSAPKAETAGANAPKDKAASST